MLLAAWWDHRRMILRHLRLVVGLEWCPLDWVYEEHHHNNNKRKLLVVWRERVNDSIRGDMRQPLVLGEGHRLQVEKKRVVGGHLGAHKLMIAAMIIIHWTKQIDNITTCGRSSNKKNQFKCILVCVICRACNGMKEIIMGQPSIILNVAVNNSIFIMIATILLVFRCIEMLQLSILIMSTHQIAWIHTSLSPFWFSSTQSSNSTISIPSLPIPDAANGSSPLHWYRSTYFKHSSACCNEMNRPLPIMLLKHLYHFLENRTRRWWFTSILWSICNCEYELANMI